MADWERYLARESRGAGRRGRAPAAPASPRGARRAELIGRWSPEPRALTISPTFKDGVRDDAPFAAAAPVAWLLIVAVLIPACASRNVPPIGYGGKPFQPEPDEVALWNKAEKEEQELLKKNKPYDDPLLEDYLGKIGDRLLPDTVRAAGGPGYRFGVIRDPTLNAFAMPNGRVYIHTGLLAQVQNESQLATIVGHEMTHVTNRHALSFTRDAQTKQIIYTVAAIAASIGVAAAAGSMGKNNPVGGRRPQPDRQRHPGPRPAARHHRRHQRLRARSRARGRRRGPRPHGAAPATTPRRRPRSSRS